MSQDKNVPFAVCDGKEQEAFEKWAASQKLDMSCHPMFYLFLNPRTDTAREAWKAAIRYCKDQLVDASTHRESKPVKFTIPHGFRNIPWRDVRIGQEVYVVEEEREGTPEVSGPFVIVSVVERHLTTMYGNWDFSVLTESLLIKDPA